MSESVRAVLNAWTDPGPVPRFHEEWQDRLRRHWPTLADALDRMSGQMLADDANGYVTVKAGDLTSRHIKKLVRFAAQPGLRAEGLLEYVVAFDSTVTLAVGNVNASGTDGRFTLDPDTDVEVWFA